MGTIPAFERNSVNYQSLVQLEQLDFHTPFLIQLVLKGDLNLSNDTQLDELALITACLGIDSVELSRFYTAIAQLKMNQMDTKHELDYLNDINHTLDEFQVNADKELDKLQTLLSNLQEQAHEPREQEQTEHDLTSEYLYLKEQYNALAIEKKGLTLSRLFELESRANGIEKVLKEKKRILKTYEGLPSDMVLASMKVRETQKELHQLEQQREALLTEIAQSVHH
ncbi:uncharacterized protein B0P05DRAFT_541228 [Gilbertella persicaria]|uniref:uncharacterized protein n=1 Tax=Gilbertella persicaria TaxID=101096 RepID=UPI00222106B2|nr:uncharacterized protein B0P05DRAFT_541228 [Gilbertella persicaria]KAI8079588.1 hypothetical protein B0P05DRAFT_541228 [Gilbertella persicaria]